MQIASMPAPPRPIEPGGVGPIRNTTAMVGVETPVADGVDERLQVAAASRDQHAEAPIHDRFEWS